MNPELTTLDEDCVEYLFDGVGDATNEAGKCDDECVGGTANTKAMQATNPVGEFS